MPTSIARTPKIAIVGLGNVGSAFAYALTLRRLVGEIVLIDANAGKAEGEAMDLRHGLPLIGPMTIRSGGYDLCEGADIVVIAAGVNQKPGQDRLDLLRINAGIIRDVIREIMGCGGSPIILMATNPVDILTLAALRESGLPKGRVMGSGTLLDSSRFRQLLSEILHVDVRGIHALIIGEHGDSELAVWSRANVSGIGLAEFCRLRGTVCDAAVQRDILAKVRQAAYAIIERKGVTAYAIGVSLCRIVEAVLRDEKSVLTLSTSVKGVYGLPDVCLSLPCVVGGQGVEMVLETLLSPEEQTALQRSADILAENARQLDLL